MNRAIVDTILEHYEPARQTLTDYSMPFDRVGLGHLLSASHFVFAVSVTDEVSLTEDVQMQILAANEEAQRLPAIANHVYEREADQPAQEYWAMAKMIVPLRELTQLLYTPNFSRSEQRTVKLATSIAGYAFTEILDSHTMNRTLVPYSKMLESKAKFAYERSQKMRSSSVSSFS